MCLMRVPKWGLPFCVASQNLVHHIGTLLNPIFPTGFTGQGFSIRILCFGWMELDYPTLFIGPALAWRWVWKTHNSMSLSIYVSREQRALKNINSCWKTKITFYLETSGGQSSNLYLNVVHFFTPVLIRHLWQLKTVAFQHRCLEHAVLFMLSP